MGFSRGEVSPQQAESMLCDSGVPQYPLPRKYRNSVPDITPLAFFPWVLKEAVVQQPASCNSLGLKKPNVDPKVYLVRAGKVLLLYPQVQETADGDSVGDPAKEAERKS